MTPADLFWAAPTVPLGAVHHFAADWKQWILFEQTEPDTPDHPALRCLALQHAIRHYCGSGRHARGQTG
jgi:hypothetical protein